VNKGVHVYYSGWVHGVGFRFTAERAAASLGLKGWVKNTRDSRVEIMAEGKEAALNEFLQKMQSVFKTYIRDTDIEWSEAAGELDDFEIRFDD